MKKTYNKSKFLLSSMAGLVLITGLVHARALEPNIEAELYLRPDISPYVSSTESKLSVDMDSTSTDISETRLYTADDLSSSTEESSTEVTESLFERLMKRIHLDKAAIISKISTKETAEPLMISPVTIKNNSPSSVTLTWELNKFADVTIYYSTSSPVTKESGAQFVKVSAFRFASEATLEGLEANTEYNYLVVVDNSFNKDTTSLTGTFKTASQ